MRQLRKIVGREHVQDSPEVLLCYSYDATKQERSAEAVVSPASAQEVSQVLAYANDKGIPVYPRGMASGLSGGCVPLEGGIILDMLMMNQILDISRTNMTALAQPGVICEELQKSVEGQRLFFPPDPASSRVATIGGMIAENAGGLRCIKYGTTRDYVLGLEAVLPSGQIIHTGAKTLKSVTGYDLTRLLVGSEGTLVVVTEATLALIPLPPAEKTIVGSYPSVEGAMGAALNVLEAGILPRALEFIDEPTLFHVADFMPQLEWLKGRKALLLVEVDGEDSNSVEAQAEAVSQAISPGALQVVKAASKEQAEEFWEVRRAMAPALFRTAPSRIVEDVCVPRDRMKEMLATLKGIASKYSVRMFNYGHVGDGNIHSSILLDERDLEEMGRAEKAVEEMFSAALELKGTLTGEHGIGNAKSRYIHWEVGSTELELMKGLKRLFDPKGILNPGKIFPEQRNKGSDRGLTPID